MDPRASITISSVLGNSQKLDGGAMFGNAPRQLWQRWHTPDDQGRIKLNCRAMLIEVGELKILCETGIGCYLSPDLARRYGVIEEEHVLVDSLNQLGLAPSDIDYVILSHLHFDHAGGLLPSFQQIQQGDDELIFSKAKFVVGQEAMQRAKNPHSRDRASFIPGLVDKLQSSGRLLVVNTGQTIEELPFIDFTYSNGHTPGQMHVIVKGQKHAVVFAGDLIPGVSWVHLPITMGYDRYPELLIDEKANLYEKMGPSWRLFFTHDPGVALAAVEKNPKGKFQTAHEHQELLRFPI